MGIFRDITGQRFGRLTALRPAGKYGRTTTWLCACACGKETIVVVKRLRSGETKSCGCLRREVSAARGRKTLTVHGMNGTPEHRTWMSMMSRCFVKRAGNYKRYGGRGITVVDRCRTFANFFTDMGKKPTPRHTLDRFPNKTGNYGPGNCRWATWTEQERNRSDARMLTFAGETLNMSAWADRLSMDIGTLSSRLRHGWTVDRALATPTRKRKMIAEDWTKVEP